MRHLSSSLILAAALLGGCWTLKPRGTGTAEPLAVRRVIASAIAVPAGYRVEVVATGLTFPVGITFDDGGIPYVVESGYSYVPSWDTPRLLRLESGGATTVVAVGEEAPWTGVDFHDGVFHVAEGGMVEGGKILRIGSDGTRKVLVEGLPGHGDHHTNGPVVGPDGMVYFSQGTATNSGYVGLDNYEFGWLKRRPDYHDIPCQDIRVTGVNFTTDNPLTPIEGDEAITGAYAPFGVPREEGELVSGQVPCSGAVMRVSPAGGTPELVAWGFRNPFGLAFAPDGQLYVTDNGFDLRGSRPIFGAPDLLWRVEPGAWHGWPDLSGGQPVMDQRYDVLGYPRPQRVLVEWPNDPPEAAAYLAVHGSADGLDFSRSSKFGYEGQAFVAQFGDMAPVVGKALAPIGRNVVRVDPSTGVVAPFAVNRALPKDDPTAGGGLARPVDVAFDPGGDALYIVDFGLVTMDEAPQPQKRTGVIWRIVRSRP